MEIHVIQFKHAMAQVKHAEASESGPQVQRGKKPTPLKK